MSKEGKSLKEIIFAMDENSPKYIQIYQKLKAYMEQGDIQPNEKLPSIRHLADSLQCSRNTTLIAYEQLQSEGYIRSEGRRGYFANTLEPIWIHSNSKVKANTPPKQKKLQIDFRAGAVDATHFPIKAWRKYTNQVFTMPQTFTYGEPFGEECLRQEIAQYLFQSRGVHTQASHIIIGSSTQQMLIHLGAILKPTFDHILLEDPGYDGAKEAFQFHQFQLEYLPVQQSGIDFSDFDVYKSKIVYVTPSHQSPLGVTMPIHQRHMILQWANTNGGYIIEDDYDSEFRYTQKPFPALASIDSSRVIYIGNFSKALLPGLRLCFMVLPDLLLEDYQKAYINFENTASKIHQLTIAKFMEDGEWQRHIKRMRLVYKHKMQLLVSELQQHFDQRITIIGEQSGLYLLIKVHLQKSENWLIEQACLFDVKVYSTAPFFFHSSPSEPILKLGFSNLTHEEIIKGVELLKDAWL